MALSSLLPHHFANHAQSCFKHCLWQRLCVALGLAITLTSALAQERITLVSPFPPGGPVDQIARILADGMHKKTNLVAIVETMPGAAGNLGMDKVRKAQPDGRTLLVIPAGNLTINPTLMPNFPFNIERDFVPITMLAKAPNILVASSKSDIASVRDLLMQAKSHPNSLAYASPGVGSGLHLAGELFKLQTQTELLHVPYKGTGPAMTDVMGGIVPLFFTNLPAALPHLRTGKLVPLGLIDSVRSPIAPNIPTLAEQGVKDVVVTSWYGLLAPMGTPTAIAEQLARDARDILSQPAIQEQLKAQGLLPSLSSPAEFAQHIRQETQVWARVIKTRNIVAE